MYESYVIPNGKILVVAPSQDASAHQASPAVTPLDTKAALYDLTAEVYPYACAEIIAQAPGYNQINLTYREWIDNVHLHPFYRHRY